MAYEMSQSCKHTQCSTGAGCEPQELLGLLTLKLIARLFLDAVNKVLISIISVVYIMCFRAVQFVPSEVTGNTNISCKIFSVF